MDLQTVKVVPDHLASGMFADLLEASICVHHVTFDFTATLPIVIDDESDGTRGFAPREVVARIHFPASALAALSEQLAALAQEQAEWANEPREEVVGSDGNVSRPPIKQSGGYV